MFARMTHITPEPISRNAGPFVRPMLRFFDRISCGLQTDLEAAVRAGEGRLKFDEFQRRTARSELVSLIGFKQAEQGVPIE